MKVRILDDSIRLRLDRAEVLTISQLGAVEGATHFPDGAAFGYSLRAAAESAADFFDGRIEISLPERAISHWALTETEVSIECRLSNGRGDLKILVEKDFECVEPREGENQANRFPNPNA